jgi:molybdenum cofactor biosynthesis enzyme MoaA
VGLPPAVWVRLHSRQRLQRKLRISVTDHCNFTCFFCHNEGQGPIRRTARAALRTDEIQSVVRVALAEGVTKIKLTGGEPLLFRSGREDAVTLVRKLAQLRQEGEVFDLSMTTNGSLLPGYAERLALAGLDRVTVSMTTTRSTTFGALIASNQRMLHRVLSGLAAAQRVGLTPLKINAVLYHSARHGLGNLGDIRELYQAAVEYGVSELRFFTLLWHDSFERFDDFYHFFSPEMREALASLLRHCRVVAPVEIVEILSALAVSFAHRVYPKIEFGLVTDQLRLGFEAMKFGRLPGNAGLQEGPYAMRLSGDGALRATLTGSPSYELIRGIRDGLAVHELRHIYRAALEEMP